MMRPATNSPRVLLDHLLPHSGPARLLTEIVRIEQGFVEATGRIQASHPLASTGRAPSFLGIELGAQAAAALEPIQAAAQGSARIGFLARVREALFLRPHLPVDTPLTVTAQLEAAAAPLAIYRISVRVENVEFVRAILSTYSGGP